MIPRTTCFTLPALCLALLAACNSDRARTDKLVTLYTETAEGYMQLGDLDRAEYQARKGLDLSPGDIKLELILGWALQRRGRTDDVQVAERVFRHVLEKSAGSEDVRGPLGLAASLERQGLAHVEAADAIESGKHVTEAADPKARVAEHRALAQAKWLESRRWYARSLDIQENLSEALSGAMRVESLLGEREKSLEFGRRLLTAVATDRAFWEQRVRKADVNEREEEEFRKIAQRLVDQEIPAQLHCATLLADLGRRDEALQHLDAALVLDPDRADVYALRGQIRKEAGRYGEAIGDLERFMALSPQAFDHPDVQKAWAMHRECEAAQRAQGTRHP